MLSNCPSWSTLHSSTRLAHNQLGKPSVCFVIAQWESAIGIWSLGHFAKNHKEIALGGQFYSASIIPENIGGQCNRTFFHFMLCFHSHIHVRELLRFCDCIKPLCVSHRNGSFGAQPCENIQRQDAIDFVFVLLGTRSDRLTPFLANFNFCHVRINPLLPLHELAAFQSFFPPIVLKGILLDLLFMI